MERMACSFFGKGSSFLPMLLGLTSASNIWRREKSWYWKSYDGSQCNRDGENRNHQQSTNQQRRTYRVINLHFDLMPPPVGRIFVSVVLVHDGGWLTWWNKASFCESETSWNLCLGTKAGWQAQGMTLHKSFATEEKVGGVSLSGISILVPPFKKLQGGH